MPNAYLPSPRPPSQTQGCGAPLMSGVISLGLPGRGLQRPAAMPHTAASRSIRAAGESDAQVIRNECHRGHCRGRGPAQHCHRLLSRRYLWRSRANNYCRHLCLVPSSPSPWRLLAHGTQVIGGMSPLPPFWEVRGTAWWTPVSASLVTFRATLCLLFSYISSGRTWDGVNKKASRHLAAMSDRCIRLGRLHPCPPGQTYLPCQSLVKGRDGSAQPLATQEASVLQAETLRPGCLGSKVDEGLEPT